MAAHRLLRFHCLHANLKIMSSWPVIYLFTPPFRWSVGAISHALASDVCYGTTMDVRYATNARHRGILAAWRRATAV